ncbi:MAG: monoamine oxidase [Pseudohongiellaceae bacterium]
MLPGDVKAAQTRKQWVERSAFNMAGPKPTVGAIGAGISGLVVAYELKQAGYPSYVLEARSRPGGRNHTLRRGSVIQETDSQQVCQFDANPELYFNAGAARIPQHHGNLLSYCSELGIPLQAFVNNNRGAYIHSSTAFGGQPKRAREVITSTQGYIAELLAKAINANTLSAEISFNERASVLAVLSDYGALNLSFRATGSTRAGVRAGTGGLTPAQFDSLVDV